jgi:hypothetical protein
MPQKPKGAKRRPTEDERIDESLKDSFPASDPPAHSGVVAGGPRRQGDKDGKKRRNR